ncbi:MAG TPA: MBL fold metallo-hydrolase [Pyrinomonadaceae bacterium]|nr:MBL fold metallo-hydrolase [Pyrinomonadaceae bacterium]
MELTVLGSGTSVPHPKRSSSGYWLATSSGTILLDCSASSIHRMAQERLDWPNLDAIWISHFHLDHLGGLAPLLFGTKHAPVTQSRTKTLRIFGASGLRRLIETFSEANDYRLLQQPFPIEIVEIEALEKFEILPGVEAVAFSTPHTEDSHSIHIRDKQSTLVYTSDTGPLDALAAFARRVDLLVMECSFVRNKPVAKHLELIEAIHIIRKAEPKRAVLTHLYPEWDDVDFDEEVRKLESEIDIRKAFDGMTIALSGQTEN